MLAVIAWCCLALGNAVWCQLMRIGPWRQQSGEVAGELLRTCGSPLSDEGFLLLM
jgi:hypothetical protein